MNDYKLQLLNEWKERERKLNEIKIPIFYYQKKNGKIVIDVESIKDELDERLKEIIKNPEKFIILK